MDLETLCSWILIVVIVVYVVRQLVSAVLHKPPEPAYRQFGDLTLETLELYSGFDPFRPILLSVQGRVYNVSEGSKFYGRGGLFKG